MSERERGEGRGICKLRVALIFRLAEVLRKKKPRGRQGIESARQAWRGREAGAAIHKNVGASE